MLVGDSEMLIASIVAPAKQEEEVVVDIEGEEDSEGEGIEETDQKEAGSDTDSEGDKKDNS